MRIKFPFEGKNKTPNIELNNAVTGVYTLLGCTAFFRFPVSLTSVASISWCPRIVEF